MFLVKSASRSLRWWMVGVWGLSVLGVGVLAVVVYFQMRPVPAAKSARFIYNGAGADRQWTNPANWQIEGDAEGRVLPGLSDDAVIPSAAGAVELRTASTDCRNLVLREGAQLHVSQKSGLKVHGEVRSEGKCRITFGTGGKIARPHGIFWFWLALGFLGQAFFTGRMITQWLVSERLKVSTVPLSFWVLSLLGSALLLTYAIWRRDPVFIVAQSFGAFVYVRNLMLFPRGKAENQAAGAPA